jgi:hypothetical protein
VIGLLGLVSTGPDVDAFIGGVQLGVGVAFIVVTGLVGLSIVRRIMGS